MLLPFPYNSLTLNSQKLSLSCIKRDRIDSMQFLELWMNNSSSKDSRSYNHTTMLCVVKIYKLYSIANKVLDRGRQWFKSSIRLQRKELNRCKILFTWIWEQMLILVILNTKWHWFKKTKKMMKTSNLINSKRCVFKIQMQHFMAWMMLHLLTICREFKTTKAQMLVSKRRTYLWIYVNMENRQLWAQR